MRAFLKSSEGCFQLKPHTTTIGRHEGSDIILQVRARKPTVVKWMVVWMEAVGCTGNLLQSAGATSLGRGVQQGAGGLGKSVTKPELLASRFPCLPGDHPLPVRRCSRSSCSPQIHPLGQQLRPSGLQLPLWHLCQWLPGPKCGRGSESGGYPAIRHRGSIL